VIVIAPVLGPVVVGVKVALMVQLPLGATEPPQLLAWAKSPEAAILSMIRVAVPALVNVTVCGALVVFRF
jgi:hypothetical protein